MKKNEPAFPTKAVTRTKEGVSIEDCIGLTKREYGPTEFDRRMVFNAVALADLLIAELEK